MKKKVTKGEAREVRKYRRGERSNHGRKEGTEERTKEERTEEWQERAKTSKGRVDGKEGWRKCGGPKAAIK